MEVILDTIIAVLVVSIGFYAGLYTARTQVRAAEAERDLARKAQGKLSNRIGRQRVKIRQLKDQLKPYLPVKDISKFKSSLKPEVKPHLPA